MRRAYAILITMMLATGLIIGAGASASATNVGNEKVCGPLSSGKVDVSGDHQSLEVMAPEGYLIDEYCVKAGSANQGLGPEYVMVEPPQEKVVITHSSGKDISHYSVSYVPEPSPTTTTTVPEVTTTTVPETTTTTVPEETTTTVPEETTTTVPEVKPEPPACDKNHPNWNPETELCELPMTGASLGGLALLGSALALLGGLALRATRKNGQSSVV